MRLRFLLIVFLVLSLFGVALVAAAAEPEPAYATPPRLAHIEGAASFWRPGADDWSAARLNMPLAAGDVLYTSASTTLEIQAGPRAFVRMAEKTELNLAAMEPGSIRFVLSSGVAAFDLRGLPAGYQVELQTPDAVFTMEYPGYYRTQVAGGSTRFITRRSGRATVEVGSRPTVVITPSEELVIRSGAEPAMEAYVAPPLDSWDRWNYARTEYELEALSRRYLATGVYGAGELDRYGAWRVVPPYGSVWIPDGTPAGWAPYSAGSWVWDPSYGWTWLDDAPWGWAPFHYGRWVHLDTVWAWAPGPVVVQPIYAPALVAFFSVGPTVSLGIGIRDGGIGWVALGWGEPLRPWWGPPGFMGAQWWGGWGGPHVTHPGEIAHLNARVPRAVVVVDEQHFGRGPARPARLTMNERAWGDVRALHGAPSVKPDKASFAAGARRAPRPPAGAVANAPIGKPGVSRPGERPSSPSPRPDQGASRQPLSPSSAVPRPDFGAKGSERARPPAPPRFSQITPKPSVPPAASHRAEVAKGSRPPAQQGSQRAMSAPPQQPQPRAMPSPSPSPRGAPGPTSPGAARGGHAPSAAPHSLPGRPANQVAPRSAGGGGR